MMGRCTCCRSRRSRLLLVLLLVYFVEKDEPLVGRFVWQPGSMIFSVSKSRVAIDFSYIENSRRTSDSYSIFFDETRQDKKTREEKTSQDKRRQDKTIFSNPDDKTTRRPDKTFSPHPPPIETFLKKFWKIKNSPKHSQTFLIKSWKFE